MRELADEEAWDLVLRSVTSHAKLATGRFRYVEDLQNFHALLISEGVLGMLEYGRRRFAGAPTLGYIDTVGR